MNSPEDDELAQAPREAYDSVLHEPVPARLLATLGRGPQPANDEPPVQQRARGAAAGKAWMALAASVALVIGVGIGMRIAPGEPSPLEASGALAQALERQAAARTDAPVRIGLTLQDHAGRWCRSFELPREHSAGLACREQGQWHIEVLARTQAEQAAAPDGRFRQAASALPAPVLQAIDDRAAGAPLDAIAEAQVLRGGWGPAAAPR